MSQVAEKPIKRTGQWVPVHSDDEYRRYGDTHFFSTSKYTYYWNETDKRVRRVGDTTYCEVKARSRTSDYLNKLGTRLAQQFATARGRGVLLEVENQ